MPGATLNLDPRGRDRWSQAFRKYAEWNQREAPELFVKQVREFAGELYAQTAAIAPTRSEIASDVKRLGWKIPTEFPDGRTGRGTRGARKGTDWARKTKKRGRGAAAANDAARERFFDRRETLGQMQRFVIRMRTKARLFLASGWLGAMVDLGGSLKISSGEVDHARGGAEIERTSTGVAVTLWNRTPGIEKMNAQYRLVEKAKAARVADMLIYIRRKMTEAQRTYFGATGRVAA